MNNFRLNLALVILSTLVFLGASRCNAAEAPLVAAQELHARQGMGNFLAKTAKPGAELKVGYLGGSITVARLAKEGTLLWKAKLPVSAEEKAALECKIVFAPDSVHPHVDTGHELYLQAIESSLPGVRAASKPPQPHALGAPLVVDNYETACMLPAAEAKLSAGFKALDPKDPLAARKGGETLSFKIRGTRAAIYNVVGPDVGQVTVTLDDKPPRPVPLFDAYCTYQRLSTLVIGSDLPAGLQTVKIELSAELPDKVAILSKRNEKMDRAERFSGGAFYPGALLLAGELVK